MNKKAILKKFIGVICLAILIGIAGEYAASGITYWKGHEHAGRQLLSAEQIQAVNMSLEEGAYHYDKTTGSTLTLSFEEQYIHQLEYMYQADGDFLCEITIYGEDVYGQDAQTIVQDLSSRSVRRSIVNINEKVSKIQMHFAPDQESVIWDAEYALAPGAKEFFVSDITLDNSFQLNIFRCMLFMSIAGFLLFLWTFRKEVGVHPEYGFLIAILLFGTLWIAEMPPMLMGWDEHVHLTNNALLIDSDETVSASVKYMNANQERPGLTVVQSMEEKMEMIRFLNAHGVHQEEVTGNSVGLASIGYIASALGMFLGNLLHLPFYVVYLMGRWMNLLLYSLLSFWAVKHIRIGKGLFMALALCPIAIFSAVNYSYDVLVNAFLMVGIAVIVSEFATPQECMTRRNAVIFLLSVIIGCIPKATYAPILLLGLFLPKAKFANKKEMWLFKGLICVFFMGLMATFVLPTLLAPPSTGDTRGGNTNTSQQLALILSHPFAYLSVWWNNVKMTFGEFVLGIPNMIQVGFLGNMNSSYVPGLFILLVMLTDTGYQYQGKPARLNALSRVILAFFLVMIVGMIWSALYLSFTEVGKLQIAGVQGRYYLPILGMFFLLFQMDHIQVTWGKHKYYLAVLAGSAFFAVKALWDLCGNLYIR